MDNKLLKSLDSVYSYDEGLAVIRYGVESIDKDMLSAIEERANVAEAGEREEWFRGWQDEAKAAAFLNEFFSLLIQESEKAHVLLSLAEPDIARRAVGILLMHIDGKINWLLSSLSDIEKLTSSLGTSAASQEREEFDKRLNMARNYLVLTGRLAEKGQDNGLIAEVCLREGVLDIFRHDVLHAFGERESLSALAAKARRDLEKSMHLTSSYRTRIACLFNLAKAWYDEDLNKSLDCLNMVERDLEERRKEVAGRDEQLLEESERMLALKRSKVLHELNRFEEAYEVLRPVIEALERKLWSQISPGITADMIEENYGLYENMVKACFELGKGNARFYEEAVEYAEKTKARAALNMWRTVISSGPEVDPGLIERKAKLFDEFSYKSSILNTDPSVEELNELSRLQQENDIVQQMIWEQSKLKIFDNAAWPASFDQIRKVIPHNAVLIDYFLVPDKIFIFVIDSNGLIEARSVKFKSSKLREIVMLAEVAIGLRVDYTSFKELESRGLDLPFPKLTNLEFLYKLLIDPVSCHLSGRDAAYIAPHSHLRNAPFHAFYRMEGEEKRYLIEDVAISYAPSATLLRLLDRCERSVKTCFSAGVPEEKGGPVNGLKEAEMVARIFNTRVHPGTKEAFLSEACDYDVIHLSCHSARQSVLSTSNGLLLEEGELLLPADIPSLNCSLATLSACSSYNDDTSDTRELAGMVGALLRAGSRSVLASMWPVFFESANMLMEEFYRNLTSGQSKAVALQKAQVKVRSTYSYHPLFWAPFFLVGMAD